MTQHLPHVPKAMCYVLSTQNEKCSYTLKVAPLETLLAFSSSSELATKTSPLHNSITPKPFYMSTYGGPFALPTLPFGGS